MINLPKSFKNLSFFKFENDKYYEYDESSEDLPFRLFIQIKVDQISENDYLEIPYTLHGDYCGFVSNQSNYRSIKRDFPFVKSLYADFSSYKLVVKISELLSSEELIRTIEELDEYPLYDEDDEAQLLVELEDAAWDWWVKHDFVRYLEKMDIKVNEDTHNLVKLFYDLMYRSGMCFEPEQNDVWINIEKIINFFSKEDLLSIIEENKNNGTTNS
jgi:hypothetical protein